ncbi:MAG: hypothetical protein RL490_2470, partial [Pseudomonadota bacterium]
MLFKEIKFTFPINGFDSRHARV